VALFFYERLRGKYFWFYFISKRKEKQFSILALLSSWISYDFVLVRGLLCV
jgi:hypothetical protein